MNLFQPSVKRVKTVRKESRKIRLYDKPQTPLDQLLSTSSLCESNKEELLELRRRLDPFQLTETINWKLERIWDLTDYRYKPNDIKKGIPDLKDNLSSEERETLEGIANTLV